MTPKQMLLEHMYPGDVAAYVATELADGRSWREVAGAVSLATGLSVSHESLRQWYGSKAAA